MSMRLSRVAAFAALAAALVLTGCGKRGTLDRPEPLWGDKDKASQDAKDKMPEPKASGSVYSPKPSAPESRDTSIRTDPIDGAGKDPRAGPGQATDWTRQPH